MIAAPPVLAYHKVGTVELGGTWCTRGRFRRHLDALAGAGWTALDARAFAAALGLSPPRRAYLLTFDDAFESFAMHAWPELRRRGLPVLLFVPTAWVGRRSSWDLPLPGRRVAHLDWAALRALAREGVAMGSHGATHRDLRRLDDRELERELGDSRRALEDAIALPVDTLAYPYGRHDARVRAAASAAGYRLGFGTWVGAGTALDPLALPRRGVYVTDASASLLAKLDATHPRHRVETLASRLIHAAAGLAARAHGPRTP